MLQFACLLPTPLVSTLHRPLELTMAGEISGCKFGTKEYWDSMYDGEGELPADR